MELNCRSSVRVYLITLVMIALVMGPVFIMGARAAIPQVHFTHGVASGDVTSKSAVLWTRTDQDTQVNVEVSKLPHFKKLDFQNVVHSTADSDFTAKFLAEGLKPDTLYYYRFKAGQITSEIGIFKTAPLA